MRGRNIYILRLFVVSKLNFRKKFKCGFFKNARGMGRVILRIWEFHNNMVFFPTSHSTFNRSMQNRYSESVDFPPFLERFQMRGRNIYTLLLFVVSKLHFRKKLKCGFFKNTRGMGMVFLWIWEFHNNMVFFPSSHSTFNRSLQNRYSQSVDFHHSSNGFRCATGIFIHFPSL